MIFGTAIFLIDSDGKFVAGKRQNTDHFCGFYGLPGGKPDPGETPEDTILRELREETGIVLEPADIHRLGEPVVYPLTGDRVDFTNRSGNNLSGICPTNVGPN
jgi:8-oxo-dGTP pyrophosphatase MutT (NUDIX family)